jgi:hypothetical protein
MKSLALTFLVLLAASSANAYSRVDANSTWSKILNSRMHTVVNVSIPGGLFNVCLNNDNKFETINPVSQCTKYESVYTRAPGTQIGGYYQRTCVSWAKKHLVTSRSVSAKSCVRWDYRPGSNMGTTCARYETTTSTRPLSYNVAVREITTPGRNSNPTNFRKMFTIQDCK